MEVLTLAAETTPNAVDWTTVFLALIAALVSIVSAILTFLAQRYAGAANTNARNALDQSRSTQAAVDGVKAELVAAVEGKAKAEGILIGAGQAAVAANAPTPPPAT